MSNNKPATPLPWFSEKRTIRAEQWPVADAYESREDAAYIVDAANAYPELVEALRDTRLQLALCVSALSGQDLTRPEIVAKEATPALRVAAALLDKLGEK